MNANPNTVVAIAVVSFALGIFLSVMSWSPADREGKIDVNCPQGPSHANMMLVAWSPLPDERRAHALTACDEHDRASGVQLANFAEQASNESTGARISP